MSDIKEAALFYRNLGISVIPTDGAKIPKVPKTVDPGYSWSPFKQRLFTDSEHHMFSNVGIAAVGGKVSGNLECLDLDVKNDIDQSCKEFVTYVVGRYPEMVIQETPSGGWHIIYRVKDFSPPTKKIAGRYATEEEFKKHVAEIEIYNAELFKKHEQGQGLNVKMRRAKESAKDLEVYFMETKSELGYFLLYPSPRYKIVNGDISKILTISQDEREELIHVASSYHKSFKEERVYIPANNQDDWSITPFDDYNSKVDIRGLLESHGWQFVYSRGKKDFYKRPGTSNKQSGNWDNERKWFTVFSTSTEFKELKAYKACYVYTTLEHHGDFKAAAKKLLEDGYGSSKQKEIKPTYKPSELIANYNHVWEYNRKIDNGEIPMGLVTGWPELDMYFRFKQGNFVVINGHPTVGKTEISIFLALISAVRHDWKWVLCTTENEAEWIGRSLVEMYAGKLRARMHSNELRQAELFIEDHFTILRASEFDFVYQDIIDFGVHHYNNIEKYQGFLIDPYSALSVPETIKDTHRYNYRGASALRRMAKELNVAVWLTVHSNTESQHKEDKKGYSIPPKMSECESGGLFSRRADDFVTAHRLTNHAEEYMITQLHIRKMKVHQTGGQQTKKDKPFLARYIRTGFVDDINKQNPLTYDYNCYQQPLQPAF